MPVNLEIKIQLKSFTRVKRLLKLIDAEFKGELIQKDVYFKFSRSLVKLRIENGKQSLIKYQRNEKVKNRFSEFYVIKFSEGDAEIFLTSLLNVEAIVKKKRLLYIFNNTRIHLDEVKGIGKFLELETLVINGKADAKKRFDEMIKLLKIDKTHQIKKSYRDLIKRLQLK